MLPLLLVYIAEYTINQGVAPTLTLSTQPNTFRAFPCLLPHIQRHLPGWRFLVQVINTLHSCPQSLSPVPIADSQLASSRFTRSLRLHTQCVLYLRDSVLGGPPRGSGLCEHLCRDHR